MEIKFSFAPNIKRFGTDCCALGQLSLQDDTPKEAILDALGQIEGESTERWYGKSKDGGDRAIFVITTPAEQNLVRNLVEIGFQKIAEFPRRVGYPEGMLTMWLISW
jgi:hypothetical protein